VKERKEPRRRRDARDPRAAVEEGILPGGGVYVRSRCSISSRPKTRTRKHGIEIVKKAGPVAGAPDRHQLRRRRLPRGLPESWRRTRTPTASTPRPANTVTWYPGASSTRRRSCVCAARRGLHRGIADNHRGHGCRMAGRKARPWPDILIRRMEETWISEARSSTKGAAPRSGTPQRA